MQNNELETTKQEILGAIKELSDRSDQRFEKIDQRFETIDQRFEKIDQRFEKIDQRFEHLETNILETINEFATNTENRLGRLETDVAELKTDMNSVKATMVTKDYLDEKLGDLRGDLVALTRKEDHKLVALVGELLRTGVLAKDAAKRILTMEPFPNPTYALGIND